MPFKRIVLLLLLLLSSTCLAPTVCAQDQQYQSPYRLEFSIPREELLAVDQSPPRNDHRLESKTPHEQWYSRRVRKEYGAWGPVSRQYPAISDRAELPATWKRQRLLAVAHKYVGLPYQHHHIPDWDPPADWPWKPVAYGRNSKGVDCSDFSSWVYNYGLGIRLDTGIREQANAQTVSGAGGDGSLDVEKIRDDNGYDDLVAKLKTGDLLYIRNKKGVIGHVIMWVGVHGRSPDGTPLVIDCTGEGHKDSNGVDIPIGVHLRPFGKDSWYYKSFAHANRILKG